MVRVLCRDSESEAPAEQQGKALSKALAEDQSEAPAEASSKALGKAFAEAPDPQRSEPRAEGPDLRPAKPRFEVPGNRRSAPKPVPTNQEPPYRPRLGLSEPLGEPPTEGGVWAFPSLTCAAARDITHFHPW